MLKGHTRDPVSINFKVGKLEPEKLYWFLVLVFFCFLPWLGGYTSSCGDPFLKSQFNLAKSGLELIKYSEPEAKVKVAGIRKDKILSGNKTRKQEFPKRRRK